MSREIKTDQNYLERLLRLIPSEIVAAYLIITGIIPGNASKWGHLIVSCIILAIIPFYLWRALNVKNKMQIIVTAIAFIVWIYSLNGGPFNPLGLYKPWIASIILILSTVIMPILIQPDKIPGNDDIKTEKTGRKVSNKKSLKN